MIPVPLLVFFTMVVNLSKQVTKEDTKLHKGILLATPKLLPFLKGRCDPDTSGDAEGSRRELNLL